MKAEAISQNSLTPFLRGGKMGFINREGQEVIPATYREVRRFSEGLAAVAIGAAGTGERKRNKDAA